MLTGHQMSYADAATGSLSISGKLRTIKSSWETEFGHEMTYSEENTLFTTFTINETFSNIKKVIQIHIAKKL